MLLTRVTAAARSTRARLALYTGGVLPLRRLPGDLGHWVRYRRTLALSDLDDLVGPVVLAVGEWLMDVARDAWIRSGRDWEARLGVPPPEQAFSADRPGMHLSGEPCSCPPGDGAEDDDAYA
jgi:hypothetical protein